MSKADKRATMSKAKAVKSAPKAELPKVEARVIDLLAWTECKAACKLMLEIINKSGKVEELHSLCKEESEKKAKEQGSKDALHKFASDNGLYEVRGCCMCGDESVIIIKEYDINVCTDRCYNDLVTFLLARKAPYVPAKKAAVEAWDDADD